jgi:hypothetical protein
MQSRQVTGDLVKLAAALAIFSVLFLAVAAFLQR